TMLFDITRQMWSDELLECFGIPKAILPEIVTSSGGTIRTSQKYGSVPVSGIAGDQHASLFGHMCFSPGMAKCTYGTGTFVVMNTGATPALSQSGLLTSPAWTTPSAINYTLEGAVLVSGSAVQWLRDGLGIISSAAEIEALAESVPDADGVVFVPALTGLGAPEWDPDARGLMIGLSRGTTSAHIARATLDAIAAQVAVLTGLMATDANHALTELRVDGGASRNNLLMQIQADLAGVPVTRSTMTETTAFGAALLAGLGVGLWSGPEAITPLRHIDRQFDPAISVDQRHERLTTWHRAVQRALGWAAAAS
ncbi:MAG TPA: FGGY-family carbohydrate kinase, partial [Thermomicrobiales bacterium]|nr:FGGY-family carbohydrate kinase [Thermomicrobiales bacterium]